MSPPYVRAKIGFINENGKHGPYIVCYIEGFRDFRGTIPITISLKSDVWQDKFIPQKRRDEGMDILLRRDLIFRKKKGWRAMWALMYRPEDKSLLVHSHPKINIENTIPCCQSRAKTS